MAAGAILQCLQIGVCSVGNIRRPRPGPALLRPYSHSFRRWRLRSADR